MKPKMRCIFCQIWCRGLLGEAEIDHLHVRWLVHGAPLAAVGTRVVCRRMFNIHKTSRSKSLAIVEVQHGLPLLLLLPLLPYLPTHIASEEGWSPTLPSVYTTGRYMPPACHVLGSSDRDHRAGAARHQVPNYRS